MNNSIEANWPAAFGHGLLRQMGLLTIALLAGVAVALVAFDGPAGDSRGVGAYRAIAVAGNSYNGQTVYITGSVGQADELHSRLGMDLSSVPEYDWPRFSIFVADTPQAEAEALARVESLRATGVDVAVEDIRTVEAPQLKPQASGVTAACLALDSGTLALVQSFGYCLE